MMSWEFKEPDEAVDLERIDRELNQIPTAFALSYLRELEQKAPIVYQRLRAWREEKHGL